MNNTKKNNSSSFHSFNADLDHGRKKLNLIEKIIWIILNFLNNNLPPKKFKSKKTFYIKTKVKNFANNITKNDWLKISKESTPSRMLCDLFWLKLNWKAIKSELGNINIFDTGCGDGNYGIKINEYSSGINSYFGIDSNEYKEWENLNKIKFMNLKKFKSVNFLKKIPKNTNLFITQSAIEHFENDLDFFRQINHFINKKDSDILQIHLFPTPPSLWLYLHHGVRQYNMRSIEKILKIFSNKKNYSVIYPLGGRYSYFYHFLKVTIPEYFLKSKIIYRISENKEYFSGAQQSIIRDINRKNWNHASFCALVIHSNYKKKIF